MTFRDFCDVIFQCSKKSSRLTDLLRRQLCLLTRAVPTALGLAGLHLLCIPFGPLPSEPKVSLTARRGDARCVVPRWQRKSLVSRCCGNREVRAFRIGTRPFRFVPQVGVGKYFPIFSVRTTKADKRRQKPTSLGSFFSWSNNQTQPKATEHNQTQPVLVIAVLVMWNV